MSLNVLELNKKKEQQLYLADMIPVEKIMNDEKTVLTKYNSLIQVIKVQGKNYSGISQGEIEDLFNKRKAFFNLLNNDLKMTIFSMRKKIDASAKHVDLGNEYANLVAQEHQKSFSPSSY